MASSASATEWFRNDEFWTAFRPAAFGPVRWNRAAADVDALIRLLGLRAGERLLDLCCGPGRHALQFARLGYRTTAVDLSPAYIAELMQHCREQGLQDRLEIVHADMRDFRRPAVFDAAVCVGLSFGYLADAGEDEAVLRHLHHSLAPGGRCAIEVPSPCWPDELGPWYLVDAGPAKAMVEQSTTPDGGRVCSQWHFRQDGGVKCFDFSQRLFRADEIAELLHGVGFTDIRLYADYEGNPLADDSRRIVAVAAKAAMGAS